MLKNPSPEHRAPRKDQVIATRKSCAADGVGLSHYILTERKGH
ncbi:MAG: modified peptide precursor CbpA [Magnetococcales bacterium]|nr:modified peptide precursor CbpA [Magnetococcales bacterium]MBF0156787.1 modified peptide precursor CbpA [Magnetococcales bacterium]